MKKAIDKVNEKIKLDYVLIDGNMKFDFSYKVLVPENLEHCEYMYFTNSVYYNDNEVTNKKATPSKIGLTTGEGAILEVLQKGYKYKDKVIRPAMVKVNE